eukprot:scaffold157558_cov35-Tisochrysis_lutea.AAC.2
MASTNALSDEAACVGWMAIGPSAHECVPAHGAEHVSMLSIERTASHSCLHPLTINGSLLCGRSLCKSSRRLAEASNAERFGGGGGEGGSSINASCAALESVRCGRAASPDSFPEAEVGNALRLGDRASSFGRHKGADGSRIGRVKTEEVTLDLYVPWRGVGACCVRTLRIAQGLDRRKPPFMGESTQAHCHDCCMPILPCKLVRVEESDAARFVAGASAQQNLEGRVESGRRVNDDSA